MSDTVKALIILVGGRSEPTIATLNRLQPEDLCFIVSEAEQDIIDQEIIPKMQQAAKRWEQIVTPDPNDLLVCCRVLQKEVGEVVRRWGVQPLDLAVDYSAGAKPLSIALALCAIDHASAFCYGAEDGSMGDEVNPWDELAVEFRQEAMRLFNRAAYSQAADLFRRIEGHVSGRHKPLYKALVNLSLGYARWDAFDYRLAWGKLKEALKALEMASLFGGPPGIKTLTEELKTNLIFLEKITMGPKEDHPDLFWDLLGNAQRRVQYEERYEDGIVRLHRALEVFAQSALSRRGIRYGAVDPTQIPENIREEFIQRYRSPIDGKIKLGMIGGYRLLQAVGDEVGTTFGRHWDRLKVPLEARYQSVLGHGFEPVPKDRYQQLMDIILKVAGSRIEQIPRFPRVGL